MGNINLSDPAAIHTATLQASAETLVVLFATLITAAIFALVLSR